jgi:hypothetical protein
MRLRTRATALRNSIFPHAVGRCGPQISRTDAFRDHRLAAMSVRNSTCVFQEEAANSDTMRCILLCRIGWRFLEETGPTVFATACRRQSGWPRPQPVSWRRGANWTKADAVAAIDPRWISIALPVGMAFGAFSNGWVSDKLFNSRRSSAIVLYMVLAAITALYMYTIPTTAVYQGMVVLFLCGFFVYGPQSSFWALCPDLVGHKRAGTATGVMNFCAYCSPVWVNRSSGISWMAIRRRSCSWLSRRVPSPVQPSPASFADNTPCLHRSLVKCEGAVFRERCNARTPPATSSGTFRVRYRPG